ALEMVLVVEQLILEAGVPGFVVSRILDDTVEDPAIGSRRRLPINLQLEIGVAAWSDDEILLLPASRRLFTRGQSQHFAQHAPAFGGGTREVKEMEALERIRFPVEQDRPVFRRRRRCSLADLARPCLENLLVDDIAIDVAVLKPHTRSRFGRFDLHAEITAGDPEKCLLRRAHAFAPASGMRIGSRPAAVFTNTVLA